MLGMKSYERNYVDACRAKIDADVRAFKKSGSKELETTFFNNLVLKLEYMFVHRLTGIEGKDGNPLNEVRVVATQSCSTKASYRSTSSQDGRTRPALGSSSRRTSPC
ncbi:MAG: hypothetical protein E6K09_08015 [Methanobacteriota archaeon]|nr:MAG: hypothetical protein E6K09_08015 [Euryarchaeota archaeon]